MTHELVKQTQFCVSFIALWSQNGNFQTQQGSSVSVFVPILTYGHKFWERLNF